MSAKVYREPGDAPFSDECDFEELGGLVRKEVHDQAGYESYRRRTSLAYLASFACNGNRLPWPPEQSGVTMAEVEEAAAALRRGEKIVHAHEGLRWAHWQIQRQARLADPVATEG